MRTFIKIWVGIALLAIGFGIGIVAIAMATGYTQRDKGADNTFSSFTGSYEDVTSIDIDIKYGKVEVIEGDSFSIDAKNYTGHEFDSYVNSGTWYIRQRSKGIFRIFNVDLSFGNFSRWNDGFTPRITITIPKGFVAETFNMDIGAGEAKADTINSLKGELSVGAGSFTVDRLSIRDRSSFEVGAGQMVLEDVILKDASVDCGIGEVIIEGIMTGDNNINCGVGNIELRLTGEEDDYSYDIESGIGNISIGNSSYRTSSRKINNSTADNYLRLECGIGNISVDFD